MFEDNYPEGLKRLLVIKGTLQSRIDINMLSASQNMIKIVSVDKLKLSKSVWDVLFEENKHFLDSKRCRTTPSWLFVCNRITCSVGFLRLSQILSVLSNFFSFLQHQNCFLWRIIW